MRLWLSSKIFEWRNQVDGGLLTDIERVRRPYELLSHCSQLIANSDSELSVADAVLGLKRVINSRLQHLEDLYGFSSIRKVGALERIALVGLARPYLVKQLFSVRNDIEHNDLPPPLKERVRELIDLTWYFLRATESACKLVPDGLILQENSQSSDYQSQWVTFRFTDQSPKKFAVSGWVSKDLFSHQPEEESIEIQLYEVKDKNSFNIESEHFLRRDEECWFNGETTLKPDLQLELWRLALDAS